MSASDPATTATPASTSSMRVRRDEERRTRIEAIRAALIEGEESGISDHTPEEIMAAVIERKRRNGEGGRYR